MNERQLTIGFDSAEDATFTLCCYEQTIPRVLSAEAVSDLRKAVQQALALGVDVDECAPSLLRAVRMTAADREAQSYSGQLSYATPQFGSIVKSGMPAPSLSKNMRQPYLAACINRTAMDQVGKYFDDHNTFAKSMGVGMTYPTVPPWKSDTMVGHVMGALLAKSSDANLMTAIDENGEAWVKDYTRTVLDDARRRMFPKVSS